MQFFPDIKARAFVDFSMRVWREFAGANFIPSLKSLKVIGRPAVAFGNNAERLANLVMLPIALVKWSAQVQSTTDLAVFDLTGTMRPTTERLPTPAALNEQRQKVWDSKQSRAMHILGDGGPTPMTDEEVVYADADDVSRFLSEHFAFHLRTGMQALGASLIIGAYTALECVASDSWVAAVNSRPRTLAKFTLEHPGKKSKRKNDGLKNDGQQEPTLPFATLSEHDFDVSAAMGRILVDRDRVSFDSFYDIQDSYLRAFRVAEDPKLRPNASLSRLFSDAEKDVRTTEAIRNLLVHQGGVVDQKFIDHISKTTIPRESVGLNCELGIDCEMSARHAMSALVFAKSLLVFVDDWLHSHPAEPEPTSPNSSE
jgi:hypothetical protein